MSQQSITEYRVVLGLYVRAVEAMAGKTVPGTSTWMVEAEHLATKLFFHLASLLHLRAGTKLDEVTGFKIHFFDFASSAVLARSAFETFLTFHFVFVAPTTPDERHLRYLVWRLGGLLDRQRFTPTSEEGRQCLKREAAVIDSLRREIEENPAYRHLPKSRQEDARKGRWKFGNSWVNLAVLAGSSQRYFVGLYAYLSSYAHSGYLSALQIGQAQDQKVQYELGENHIGIGLMLMSHFLHAYGKLFPAVAEVIESYPDGRVLLQKWYLTGKDMESLYEDAYPTSNG